MSPPGDCVAGVIATEDVVGTEGFALGGCGVAGLALSPGTGDGANGVTAAEGVDGDCFAARSNTLTSGRPPSRIIPPGRAHKLHREYVPLALLGRGGFRLKCTLKQEPGS